MSLLEFPGLRLQLFDVLVTALQRLLQVVHLTLILLDFSFQCCHCVTTEPGDRSYHVFKLFKIVMTKETSKIHYLFCHMLDKVNVLHASWLIQEG